MPVSTKGFGLPKPKDRPRSSGEGLKVYPDGREKCLNNAAGRREYDSRRQAMWKRQKGLCGICRQWIREGEESFDHENGRGAGKRDDRIVDSSGKWMNAAVHFECNSEKGSRRMAYWWR